MEVQTNLILILMVGYGVIYTVKRMFNVIDYKVREDKISKDIDEYISEEEKDILEESVDKTLNDLDKTLEMSSLWK